MPRIIVTSDSAAARDPVVLFDEHVHPLQLAEENHALRFIERLGWAISDAEDASQEAARGLPRVSTPQRSTLRRRRRPEPAAQARGRAPSVVASLLPRSSA